MPQATDQQMQRFGDERIRPFAEHVRAVIAEARDHKGAIDDVFQRANGGAAWNDARTDGPPHLLAAGTGANPDDVLNFNAFISALTDILDGNGTDATNAATLRSTWSVLVDACVRPING